MYGPEPWGVRRLQSFVDGLPGLGVIVQPPGVAMAPPVLAESPGLQDSEQDGSRAHRLQPPLVDRAQAFMKR